MSALFNLASQKMTWLSDRQSLVAQNIANVNTPGYGARDVEPFKAVLQDAGFKIAATNTNHIATFSRSPSLYQAEEGEDVERSHSLNTVNLEKEMIKASDVKGDFAFSTAITKAFHRMTLMSVKG